MASLIPWPGINKQDRTAKAEVQYLKDLLGEKTYEYVNFNCLTGRARLVDSIVLMMTFKNRDLAEKLYDPSCIIMSASVAVEDILLTVAEELGMTVDTRSTAAQVYSDDGTITKYILQPLGISYDSNPGREIVDNFMNIRGFINAYRNKPLHRSSEPLCANLPQTEKKIMTILDRLASFIVPLLEGGLIKTRKMEENLSESAILKMLPRVDPPA